MTKLFLSMKLVLLIFVCVLSNLFVDETRAQDLSLPSAAVQRVTNYFTAHLSTRYMEKNCHATTYPGWEDFPTIQCTYSVKGEADSGSKTATVIMLNASPEQLARWVVYTCVYLKHFASKKCTSRLSYRILDQSGAQFPIAGIVYEDLLPKDGQFEVFAFRNGVTVGIKGVKHRGVNQPSDQEIEKSINGKVTWVGKFARIQGTTKAQVQCGTKNWLNCNRTFYQAAWGRDRNEMMIAWARVNL